MRTFFSFSSGAVSPDMKTSNTLYRKFSAKPVMQNMIVYAAKFFTMNIEAKDMQNMKDIPTVTMLFFRPFVHSVERSIRVEAMMPNIVNRALKNSESETSVSLFSG